MKFEEYARQRRTDCWWVRFAPENNSGETLCVDTAVYYCFYFELINFTLNISQKNFAIKEILLGSLTFCFGKISEKWKLSVILSRQKAWSSFISMLYFIVDDIKQNTLLCSAGCYGSLYHSQSQPTHCWWLPGWIFLSDVSWASELGGNSYGGPSSECEWLDYNITFYLRYNYNLTLHTWIRHLAPEM